MFRQIEARLDALRAIDQLDVLKETRVGLEKESLRVAAGGGISLAPHPQAWGSPLTHPWLTTDYSEALPEFITPPCDDAGQALDFLADLQSFAYRRLPGETLWATSMPCVLAGEDNVPIAQYGSSNMGRMKSVYREGLGHRYGRVMQVIAGVHFNWSMPERFWPIYKRALHSDLSPDQMRNEHYMGLVRNLLRCSWIVPYLFGASPAVCRSFFPEGESNLPKFDEHTYYEPYATSLRMGDIGYQNSREEGLGVRPCYQSVETYADALLQAISTPAKPWQDIGVKVNGEYRQLNANILQIENEYYSTVRPKPLVQGMELPALALKARGVQYVELRSLDVNAYHPLGVDEMQLRFMEALMLMCLLADSPPLCEQEHEEINSNLLLVAHRGREPGLKLSCNGRLVSLREWAEDILNAMLPACEQLDQLHGGHDYDDVLDDQIKKVIAPELTPSARMLHEMEENGEGFYQFANRLSIQHYRYFTERDLKPGREAEFEQLVSDSLRQQAEIEAQPQVAFDRFLADYFAQANKSWSY